MTDDSSPRVPAVLPVPRDSPASAAGPGRDERGIVRAPRRPEGWIAPGPAPAGARGRPELEPATDEDLCFLSGDWRLFQKRSGHRWSLDDLVTAWVATRDLDVDRSWRALDLGCGLGSVLLMVAWKLPLADVTGVEAQLDRAAMGRRSIAYNGVDARCRIVDGDLREVAGTAAAAGPFDLVTGTPPYFPRGTGVESTKTHAAAARFEHRGGVEDYLRAAAEVVAADGRIVMCSAALESDRVVAAGRALGLVHREHWAIIPRAGKAALVMVDVFTRTRASEAVPSAIDQRIVVRGVDRQWTDEFRRVREELGLPSSPPR